MTEHPILFTGPMVRAILGGTKTQTRRVVKWKGYEGFNPRFSGYTLGHYFTGNPEHGWVLRTHNGACWNDRTHPARCPYGVPGDRLWVRETWGSKDADHPKCLDGRKPQKGDQIVYRANPADDYQWGAGLPSQGAFVWRPSIHMPRWASRIILEVTDIRVERVQEISEEDAFAEGISGGDWLGNPVGEFAKLWDSINGRRPGCSWKENPWSWCVSWRQAAIHQRRDLERRFCEGKSNFQLESGIQKKRKKEKTW